MTTTNIGVVVQAQVTLPTTSQCTTYLAISDENRDLVLDQDEYVTYINLMSDYYWGENVQFEDLPLELTTNFVYWAGNDNLMEIDGSYPGANPTATQQQRLNDICFDTRTILYAITTAAPTPLTTTQIPSVITPEAPTNLVDPIDVPFETCRTNMAISDFNPQDSLLNEEEYLRFISHMSLQQLLYTDYEDLPELLRFNFVLLSDFDPITGTRSLNVTGSRPGTTIEDVGAPQFLFLEKICHQTQNAINTLHLFGMPSATRPSPTSPRPTPVPTATAPVLPPLFLPTKTTRPLPTQAPPPFASPTFPTPTARPTNSYPQCRLSITIADVNRNNQISQREYPELVFRLSGSNPLYRWETFATLPVNLRDTFNVLAAQGATVGEINVFGAAPRQDPTLQEREFLELVCSETEAAIASIPTPAPVEAPTASPTEDFSDCFRDMAFSDTNPRDNFLERTEYVKFVNLLSGSAMFRSTFYTLPKVLRDNFDTLAAVEHTSLGSDNRIGEAIYIFGSFLLQNADPIQLEFLRRVCRDTQAALETATMPVATEAPVPTTPAPTNSPAPTTRPPTLAPNVPLVPTPRPTTSAPTPPLIITRVPTPRPTPLFGTQAPTTTTLVPRPSFPTPAPEDDDGINMGAIVGGCVAALCILICCIIIGRQALARSEKDPNAIEDDDEDGKPSADDEDEEYGFSTGGQDIFGDNIGVAPSPKPSTASSASEEEEEEDDDDEGSDEDEEDDDDDDDDDDEEDEEMGASGTPSKEYGEFGGPHLPIDFGEDLENVSTSGSSSSASSGSDEERPSYDGTYDDEDDDEEDEEDLDNDAFFGGQQGGGAGWGQTGDAGNFFGGGAGGAASGSGEEDDDEEDGESGWDDEDEDSGSGSRSGSGSYSGDEEEGRSYDDDYSGSRSDDDEGGTQGDEFTAEESRESSRESSSREEDEDDEGTRDEQSQSSSQEEDDRGGADEAAKQAAVASPNAFGDTFGTDAFGAFDAGGFGGDQDTDFFGGGNAAGGAQTDAFGQGNVNFFDSPEKEDDGGDESYKSSSQEGDDDIEQVSSKLDAQIDSGDWEGVTKSIRSFDHDPDMSESGGTFDDKQSGASEDDDSDEDEDDDSDDPEVIAKRAAYRAQVEELVNRVIPDEKGNIDDMMEQFKGREEDLINTLTTMEERSSQQPVPTPPGSDSVSGSYHSNSYSGSTPSAEGSPGGVAAAAIGPTMSRVLEEESYIPSIAEGDEGEEEESEQSSRGEDEGEEASRYSDDESQSQYSEPMTVLSEEEEGSRFDEEGSQYSEGASQAEEGSYDEEGSRYSEGESQYSGSREEGDEGSYVSGDEEGSYRSGDEEGSYYSQDEGEGSYVSGEEGSGSYYSQDEEGSYDEEGSRYSGEEGESQYSGDEGSYYSGEEEGSYYSQDEEGSYVSGEDEGSYYSGDEEDRSYVDGEGSYYSGSYSGSGSYQD